MRLRLLTLALLASCAATASPHRHARHRRATTHREPTHREPTRREPTRREPTAREPATRDVSQRPPPGTRSSGCGSRVEAGVFEHSLQVGERARRYLLSVPARAEAGDEALPLVFAYHGLTGTPASLRGYFRVERAAGGGAIFVYPEGLRGERRGRSVTRWELRVDGADVAFFDAALAELGARYCVDLGRVFATGHSAGAVMTNELGCHRARALRAVAPVAGNGPWARRCDGSTSVWITHGRADEPVRFAEGEATRDRWRARDACEGEAEAFGDDGCVRWSRCADGAEVVFCAHDGDHGPPPFAPRGIWDFFRAQR